MTPEDAKGWVAVAFNAAAEEACNDEDRAAWIARRDRVCRLVDDLVARAGEIAETPGEIEAGDDPETAIGRACKEDDGEDA